MQRRPQKRRNVAIWAQGLWAHSVSASRVSTLFPPSHDSLVSSTQYTCLGVGVKGKHTRRTALGSFVDRSDLSIFVSIFACRAYVCRPRSVERFLFRVCACVCVLASYPSLCGFSLAPYDAHELRRREKNHTDLDERQAHTHTHTHTSTHTGERRRSTERGRHT